MRRQNAPITLYEAQIAVDDIDRGALAPRRPSAHDTRLPAQPHRMALRATDKSGTGTGLCGSRGMRPVDGAAVNVERPGDFVVGQAVDEYRPGMVEDDRIDLARRRPQRAPDHLPE